MLTEVRHFRMRRIKQNPSVHLVDAEPQPSLPDFDEIGQLQRVGESKMQHLIKYLETQELPDDEKLAKTILYMENYFVLENNVLYHFYEPRTKGKTDASKAIKQLWLPETLRTAALQEVETPTRCILYFIQNLLRLVINKHPSLFVTLGLFSYISAKCGGQHTN